MIRLTNNSLFRIQMTMILRRLHLNIKFISPIHFINFNFTIIYIQKHNKIKLIKLLYIYIHIVICLMILIPLSDDKKL